MVLVQSSQLPNVQTFQQLQLTPYIVARLCPPSGHPQDSGLAVHHGVALEPHSIHACRRGRRIERRTRTHRLAED